MWSDFFEKLLRVRTLYNKIHVWSPLHAIYAILNAFVSMRVRYAMHHVLPVLTHTMMRVAVGRYGLLCRMIADGDGDAGTIHARPALACFPLCPPGITDCCPKATAWHDRRTSPTLASPPVTAHSSLPRAPTTKACRSPLRPSPFDTTLTLATAIQQPCHLVPPPPPPRPHRHRPLRVVPRVVQAQHRRHRQPPLPQRRVRHESSRHSAHSNSCTPVGPPVPRDHDRLPTRTMTWHCGRRAVQPFSSLSSGPS